MNGRLTLSSLWEKIEGQKKYFTECTDNLREDLKDIKENELAHIRKDLEDIKKLVWKALGGLAVIVFAIQVGITLLGRLMK